jgi:hypothetical protein
MKVGTLVKYWRTGAEHAKIGVVIVYDEYTYSDGCTYAKVQWSNGETGWYSSDRIQIIKQTSTGRGS